MINDQINKGPASPYLVMALSQRAPNERSCVLIIDGGRRLEKNGSIDNEKESKENQVDSDDQSSLRRSGLHNLLKANMSFNHLQKLSGQVGCLNRGSYIYIYI